MEKPKEFKRYKKPTPEEAERNRPHWIPEDLTLYLYKQKPVPQGAERKELIEQKEKETRNQVRKERKYKTWNHINTPLSVRNDPNDYREVVEIGDESDMSFEGTFIHVLPEAEDDLQKYIERNLADRKGQAVAIEFGGVGSALFAGFTPGFFKQTAGVVLVDNREKYHLLPNTGEKKVNPQDNHGPIASKEEDEARNHSVIEGNILSPRTYQKIDTWLNRKKVDLIIERLVGGITSIPDEPYTVAKTVSKWYEMLHDGGILLVQVPVALHDILPAWANMVREKYGDVLEVQIELELHQFEDALDLLRIRKLPGAPETLPLLDPRTVKKIGVATLEIIPEDY
jgi:hypothetical protein